MDNKNVDNKSSKMSKKQKPSQTSEVLKYLQTHTFITDAIAVDNFGAYRLSDIIFRLRKRGYDIETKLVTTKNRYGNSVNYAEYHLVG